MQVNISRISAKVFNFFHFWNFSHLNIKCKNDTKIKNIASKISLIFSFFNFFNWYPCQYFNIKCKSHQFFYIYFNINIGSLVIWFGKGRGGGAKPPEWIFSVKRRIIRNVTIVCSIWVEPWLSLKEMKCCQTWDEWCYMCSGKLLVAKLLYSVVMIFRSLILSIYRIYRWVLIMFGNIEQISRNLIG